MKDTYYSEIATCWGIQIKEWKKLSDRAILLYTKDRKKFVLKKKGNTQQISAEIELLKHLQSNSIKVHYPLINSQGEFITNFKNENYCMYNFLEGMTFSATECLKNPISPVLFGETIASLHKEMNTARNATNFTANDLYSTVFGWAVNKVLNIDDSQQLKAIFKNLEQELQPIIQSLPKQLIHRDAHISNIIYKDNQLSGVIDFDIVEVNIRIFDICYCSTSILSEVFSDRSLRETWFTFVANLFATYNKTNALTKIEINSIWHIMLSIQIIFMAFFANSSTLFDRNKAMFIWIYENKIKLEQITVGYFS